MTIFLVTCGTSTLKDLGYPYKVVPNANNVYPNK